jgi:hypothetical protein
MQFSETDLLAINLLEIDLDEIIADDDATDASDANAEEETEPRIISYHRGSVIDEDATSKRYVGLDTETGALITIKEFTSESSRLDASGLNELAACFKALWEKHMRQRTLLEFYSWEQEENLVRIISDHQPLGSVQHSLEMWGPFTLEVVRSITKQILLGLHYLHLMDERHGNMSASNIWLGRDGWTKLSDFGLPLSLLRQNAAESAKPPEILEGSDEFNWEKIDVWSVGCIILQMLTGVPPWENGVLDRASMLSEGNHHGVNWLKMPPAVVKELRTPDIHFINACLLA